VKRGQRGRREPRAPKGRTERGTQLSGEGTLGQGRGGSKKERDAALIKTTGRPGRAGGGNGSKRGDGIAEDGTGMPREKGQEGHRKEEERERKPPHDEKAEEGGPKKNEVGGSQRMKGRGETERAGVGGRNDCREVTS